MAIVIKIGSNVATDERGELREDVLTSIAAQVAALHEQQRNVVLVTSGAISRGMNLLGLSARPGAMAELQASSAVGQGQVYARYDRLLGEHGVKTAQVLLTLRDVLDRVSYLNARRTLAQLLDWRVVPIVNENDTTATDEITFGDNDGLAALIAVTLKAEQLILVSDVDALYDADPKHNPDARPVREVNDFVELERMEIGDGSSGIGSGGMRSKVNAARMATDGGVSVAICGGHEPGAIAAMAGDRIETGTRFAPHANPLSSFKIWIRWGLKTQGQVTVDHAAAEALRANGASLLPVGIVDVRGEFAAGDAVEVSVDAAGSGFAKGDGVEGDERTVAKGIVNYGSDELRRIKGLKSEQVQKLMPHASDEAVHRDNMVLT
jgi:glutamate 5-kinase